MAARRSAEANGTVPFNLVDLLLSCFPPGDWLRAKLHGEISVSCPVFVLSALQNHGCTHTDTPGICGWESEAAEREGIQNLGSSATAARPWNREDGTLFQAWRPFHRFSRGLPAFGNVLSMTHSCNAPHSRPPSITVTEVQLLSYTGSGTDDGEDASTRCEGNIASLSWWLRRR
jgi:hypothetical protein